MSKARNAGKVAFFVWLYVDMSAIWLLIVCLARNAGKISQFNLRSRVENVRFGSVDSLFL